MKLYDIIYADPPWEYQMKAPVRKRKNGSSYYLNPAFHYSVMTDQEIMDMEIPAQKNALLVMWTTAVKLPIGLKVIEAWGFEYITNIVWDKDTWLFTGRWHGCQHEHLLIARKGKFSPPFRDLKCDSIIRIKRKVSNQILPSTHSKKPQFFRNLINDWYPDKSKIELFARQSSSGFDVWGNQSSNLKFRTLKEFI